jgi:hypothetical protein
MVATRQFHEVGKQEKGNFNALTMTALSAVETGDPKLLSLAEEVLKRALKVAGVQQAKAEDIAEIRLGLASLAAHQGQIEKARGLVTDEDLRVSNMAHYSIFVRRNWHSTMLQYLAEYREKVLINQ